MADVVLERALDAGADVDDAVARVGEETAEPRATGD
jgi:sirohydrochlorin cobaltochelatase